MTDKEEWVDPGDPVKRKKPVMVTERIREQVLTRMCAGESVASICKDPQMPHHVTLFRFLQGKEEKHLEFREAYSRALMFRTYFLAEQALDIARDDSGDLVRKVISTDKKTGQEKVQWIPNPVAVSRARLLCDELHWHIERLNGTKYGRPVQVDPNGGGPGEPTIVQFIDYRDLPDEPAKPKRPPNLTIENPMATPVPGSGEELEDEDDI
jgi:hypothetical protein